MTKRLRPENLKHKSQDQIIDILVRKAWDILKEFKPESIDTRIHIKEQADHTAEFNYADYGISISDEVCRTMLKENISLEIKKNKTCIIYICPDNACIEIFPYTELSDVEKECLSEQTLLNTDIKLYYLND